MFAQTVHFFIEYHQWETLKDLFEIKQIANYFQALIGDDQYVESKN